MKKIIAIFTFILLFLAPAFAEISCRKCEVGNCVCEITDCDSGIFDVFSSTSCSLTPDYEYIFSEGYVKWKPASARSYYVKVFCSDGETQSDCILITVRALEVTTTTTRPTQLTTTTTTLPSARAEGPNYLLWILIVILMLLLLFAIYYFFFMKKGKRKTYEELYRKWGRR
jgi:hypothetical protein